MEIDTGSGVSIVSEKIYKANLKTFPLSKTDIRLKSYSGDAIEIIGQCEVPVKYRSEDQKLLPLQVVQGDRPSLVGRNWLEQLQLNWTQIFAVQADSVDILKREFNGVFKKHDFNTPIKGFTANIVLNENSKPVFCKARTVPFALKETVENELRRLRVWRNNVSCQNKSVGDTTGCCTQTWWKICSHLLWLQGYSQPNN